MMNIRGTFSGSAASLLILLSAAVCAASPLTDPPESREIKITATRDDLSPRTIRVYKGEHIKLVVTSQDIDHAFAISEFNISKEIKATQSQVIELMPIREGRFQLSCTAIGEESIAEMIGELVVEEPIEAAVPKIRVTFEPAARGVVIVESNGERVRIDTSNNTVERLSRSEEPGQTPPQAPSQAPASGQRESSRAYEPYDYHIVNIPTPKAVRRHSLNMHFTHRFQETITPFDDEDASQHIARISKDLLGLDSSSVSSFGVTYGITDRLYANVYRSPLCQPGLCKTIELGFGFHLLDEAGRSPIALSAYSSVEGDYNFTERFTYNFQAMIGRSVTKYVNVFFSPAAHINSNGSNRFKEFLSSQPLAAGLRLGRHSGSFGFGVNGRIRPTTSLLFEYTPRVGFKMGQISADFDPTTGQITGFRNRSEAAIGFGIEKRIGRHVFSLTFSNTQATTTARYNSSNLALPPSKFAIGFNLFRRLH